MYNLVNFKKMKANLQRTFNRFNPKRKSPKGYKNGGEYLFHERIPKKIELHIHNMYFKKTNFGIKFWNQLFKKAFETDLSTKELVLKQVNTLAKKKGISNKEAKRMLIEDIKHMQKQKELLIDEIQKAHKQQLTKLNQTTIDGYGNISMTTNAFIYSIHNAFVLNNS